MYDFDTQKFLELAKRAGVSFPHAEIRGLITPSTYHEMAEDAALVTAPNGGIPAEFLMYLNPAVITILNAKRTATELFDDEQNGDWTTEYQTFRVDENVGNVTQYSDYGDGATSDVNFNFPTRPQHRIQTTISYGDLETARAGEARIQLAASKQAAAADIIGQYYNRYNFFGVAGKEIYGVLNEPNHMPAVPPKTATGGAIEWVDKTADEIWEDIVAALAELAGRSGGHIDANSNDLIMAIPPTQHVYLSKKDDFGTSVMEMIKNYFGDRLKIIVVPELANAQSGNTMLFYAKTILGTETGRFAFTEKFRAGRVVENLSNYRQKYMAGLYGFILNRPFAIVQMVGI